MPMLVCVFVMSVMPVMIIIIIMLMMPMMIMMLVSDVSVLFAFGNNACFRILNPSFAMRIVKRTVTTATRTSLVFHF